MSVMVDERTREMIQCPLVRWLLTRIREKIKISEEWKSLDMGKRMRNDPTIRSL